MRVSSSKTGAAGGGRKSKPRVTEIDKSKKKGKVTEKGRNYSTKTNFGAEGPKRSVPRKKK